MDPGIIYKLIFDNGSFLLIIWAATHWVAVYGGRGKPW